MVDLSTEARMHKILCKAHANIIGLMIKLTDTYPKAQKNTGASSLDPLSGVDSGRIISETWNPSSTRLTLDWRTWSSLKLK